jgi:drug/metabolite transporter (DMT)-like permease
MTETAAHTKASKTQIILGFATIYLVWSSTYLAIRFVVETIPPFMSAGVRFFLGGMMFYAWAKYRGAESPQKKHWLPAALIGLGLIVGGNGGVSWAEQIVPSGLTALLVAIVPLWIVLADWIRPGGAKPSGVTTLGLAIGFAGMLLLINPFNVSTGREIEPLGALVLVFATMSWATGSIYSRHAPSPKSQILGVGMQMLVGGAVLLVISAVSGEFNGFSIAQVSLESLVGFVFLTTIGSFAFGVYIWLLKASTPAKVATYAYVNPVLALVLGTVFASEPFTLWTFGCSLVIVTAVIIIVSSRKAPQQIQETEKVGVSLNCD